MKLPALSCLFDHLIGVMEQDQAVGDTEPRKRGCRKSPENMAGNDAEVDEEVRHIAKVSVCSERAYVRVSCRARNRG